MYLPFELSAGPEAASEAPRIFALRIASEAEVPAQCPWLDEHDMYRAAAIVSPRRRAQFVAGRWLLHHAARALLGEDGWTVQTADPRPGLRFGEQRIAASIAHSRELVLCAVGRVWALGVDVEWMRARADWEALVARVLHPAEREVVLTADEAERWRAFYRAWTLKEALAKALGAGLALPFERICLAEESRAGWRLRPLEAAAGFAAAVAWRDRP